MFSKYTIKKHGKRISGEITAFKRFETGIIVGSNDNTIRIFDIRDEKIVERSVFSTHVNKINCLDSNVEYILSGSYDNSIIVYNKKNVGENLEQHYFSEPISACKFISKDRYVVASGSIIQFREIGKNEPFFSAYTPGGISSISCNHTTQQIALSTIVGKVLIYSYETGRKQDEFFAGKNIRKIRFTSNGLLWILKEQLTLWNIRGEQLENIGSLQQIVDFTLHDNTLIVAKSDSSIVFVQQHPLKTINAIKTEYPISKVTCLADNRLIYLSYNSNIILCNNNGLTLDKLNRLFSIPRSVIAAQHSIFVLGLNGEITEYSHADHKDRISELKKSTTLKLPMTATSMVYVPFRDKNSLLTGTTDGKIYQIIQNNYHEIFDFNNMIWTLEKDDPYVFVGLGSPANGIIRLEQTDGTWKKTLEKRVHRNSVFSLAISEQGIASGSLDQTVRWLSLDLEERKKIVVKRPVWSLAWLSKLSNTPPRILIGAHDGYLRIQNTETEELKIEKAHDEAIRTIAVSPDEKYFITGSDDKTLKLWDTNDLTIVKSFKGKAAINSSIWHSNRYFYAVDYIGTIYSFQRN